MKTFVASVLSLLCAVPACGGSSDDPAADAAPRAADAAVDAGEDIAGTLDGLRWELPCVEPTSPELCTTGGIVDENAVLGGSAGQTYDIEVRFRGVIEPKTYTGGERDGYWQTGGSPAADTANIYQLSISAPEQTYYVNAGTTRPGDMLFCDPLDFTVTFQAEAGAMVTLTADPLDALQIQNRDDAGDPIVVDDVPPAPDSFDGQFIQMDVLGVAPAG